MTKHGLFSFHIVDESPWPIFASLGIFSLILVLIESFLNSYFIKEKLLVVFLFLTLSLTGWMRDITSEGKLLGMHTLIVQEGLKLGFVMFILSEVLFFVSIFWALFYFSVSPNESIGQWPSVGISKINPLGVPLLGTTLLLSSGFSVTWSHYSLLSGSKAFTILPLCLTILLGTSFTILQMTEYMESSFTISDSVYGSVFFLSTGFHGAHVIIGTVFLLVCLIRIFNNSVSKSHHLSYEFAIWYWHFVDVVWMILYISLYL